MHDEFHGPYFAPGLIGPDGKLSRLHKGGSAPKVDPTPPPVRESNRQVAKEGEAERAAAVTRDGYASTIKPSKKPGSLLGNYDQPGTRSLL